MSTSWRYDDGGRSAAGFRGDAGDCVTRALAIVTGEPYLDVYRQLAEREQARGRPRSARNGILRADYQAWLESRGFSWRATMAIGSGCKVHLRADELPSGAIVARLSGHLCAVVDGVIHDTHDPSRGGTRCVYGYFARHD